MIKEGVANIPTAFIAEYNSGGPIVAILGEYDALPGLSQTSDPEQKKRNTYSTLNNSNTKVCRFYWVNGLDLLLQLLG